MRRRTIKRQLVALGHSLDFEPTSEQRAEVRLMVSNGHPVEAIAAHLELQVPQVLYHFHQEIAHARQQVENMLTANLLWLANQRQDLNVALRACEAYGKARFKALREPKEYADEVDQVAEAATLTLEEVRERLARIERTRAGAAPARPGAADDAVEPD